MKGDDPKKLAEAWAAFARQIPTIAGVVAVNFFKGTFKAQGWPTGHGIDKWKQPVAGAKRHNGGGTLIGSGRLRRSIRIVQKGRSNVIVGTDAPYAGAHNDGLDWRGKVSVRAHDRKGRGRRIKGAKGRWKKGAPTIAKVKAHTRNAHIKLPKRHFLGDGPAIETALAREFVRRLRAAGFK
jgi:phage gpG-like protein